MLSRKYNQVLYFLKIVNEKPNLENLTISSVLSNLSCSLAALCCCCLLDECCLFGRFVPSTSFSFKYECNIHLRFQYHSNCCNAQMMYHCMLQHMTIMNVRSSNYMTCFVTMMAMQISNTEHVKSCGKEEKHQLQLSLNLH